MFNNFLQKSVFLSLGLLLPQLAMATTYFVNASVTTSGSGTTPMVAFKTIQEGVDAATIDGDIVRVAAGIYEENVVLNANDLMLWGADKNKTIIDGSSIGGVGITINGGQSSATVIKNLGVTNFTNGVELDGSVAPTLTSLIIRSNAQTGLVASGSYATITNSTFDSNGWYGIETSNPGSNSISHNILSNNSLAGIYLGDDSLVDRNSIYGNQYYGVDVENSLNTTPAILTSNIIYSNPQGGIVIGGTALVLQVNCIIAYNTISANGASGIVFNPVYDTTVTATIINNIIYGNATYGIEGSESSSFAIEVGYNDLYQNTAGTISGVTYTDLGRNISVPPHFIDARTNNYRLRSSSPLIGYADTSLYSVTTDYYGNTRGDNGCGASDTVEIGAVECMVP